MLRGISRRLALAGSAALPFAQARAAAPPAGKVTLTAADGHKLMAWKADALGRPKGGIVVLHAVFGATAHMGDVCARWAQAGYTAVAPALYDRVSPNENVVAYDKLPDGVKKSSALTEAQLFADVEAAAKAAGAPAKVAISGFCMGGTWAWRAGAARAWAAQVNFYGSNVFDFNDLTPKAPTIFHVGDMDPQIPMAKVEQIRARHPDMELHVYPGAVHAFENVEQASYKKDAAELAWQRSIAFMDRHVGKA